MTKFQVVNILIILALVGVLIPFDIKSPIASVSAQQGQDITSAILPTPQSTHIASHFIEDDHNLPAPAGVPEGAADATVKQAEMRFDPHKRVSLLSQLELDYTSYVYTHSDILLFAYTDGTYFEVYYASGILAWSGTLNAGEHWSLTPGAGVYLVAASKAFSINVGDALSNYVWGYYAMDQFGKGLSNLFYTYQANWNGTSYDPNFIVFAYEDNTYIEVKNTTTGQLIWSGNLNGGEHYSNSELDGAFLTVSSSKPVAALSYTDQGYYVPAHNGTFVGTHFHTYVGNSAQPEQYWTEDLNLIAYENTNITVQDSSTGLAIWFGTLNAGQVYSISDLNGTYVTVRSSGNIAVSVSPYISQPGGRYYHSIYAQDSSGTGIGTHFIVPSIPTDDDVPCKLILFSYNDNASVTIQNSAGVTVWSGVLDQAESYIIDTEFTVYTIYSNGELSVLLDCGDLCGAEFAPVHYSVVQVDITSPLGGNYYYGSSMLVTADATLHSEPLLGAVATGRVGLTTGGDYLEFEMNDEGTDGDTIADDGTYSANIAMPGPNDMPTGNYFMLVSIQVEQAGEMASGSGATIFTLTGLPDGVLTVTPTLNCPNSPDIFAEDTCALSAVVTYPDNSTHSDGSVVLTVFEPGNQETVVNLANTGNNIWQGNYTFDKGGRYLLDVKADPAPSVPYIAGYGSLVGDVFASSSPLVMSVLGLPDTFLLNQIAVFTTTVAVDGQPVSGATVMALVNPGQVNVDLISLGEGLYVGLYFADTAGDFTVDFQATSPMYKPGTASNTFAVSTTEVDLFKTIQATARSTEWHLDRMKEDAQHIAEDGDWFWQKIPEDHFMRNFNFIINVVSLGLSANKLAGELQKAATKSTAPVSSRFAGINLFSWLRDQADESIDGRTFRSWATRLETAVQSGLFDQYLKQGKFPPYIGLGVLRRASVYYASQLLSETMDEVAKGAVSEYLVNRRLDNSSFLQNELYPIFAQSADEDKTLVNDYAQAILANLPTYPGYLEDKLITNLVSLRMANYYLVRDVGQRNWNLWNAQDQREAQENAPWYQKWGLTLWKIATPILVGVACGGPVGAGVGVVITVETLIEDWIQDSNNLELDDRMHALAYGSMFTVLETKETLVGNSISGLAQVRSGISPEVPDGHIVFIDDISRGENKLWFSERQAVSSITIENTGDCIASYNIRAYYDRLSRWQTQYDVFWIDSMRDPATGETIGWIELAPGETATIEIVFKDKDQNNLDMRPNDGDDISFVLAATILEGTYFVESAGHQFDPRRETIVGKLLSASEDLPILSHPIATQLGRDSFGTEYTIRLDVANPFPYPVTTKVRQKIPSGLTILSPNGGLMESNAIQWRRVIQPHSSYEFTYIVRNDSANGADIEMSAAELTFYIPEQNTDVQFTSVPITISAPNVPTIYLPLVLNSHGTASNVFQGTVTDNGSPVAGIELLLRYYDGSAWSDYATTTTSSSGNYQFTDLPNLDADQQFYVRWYNNHSNSNWLSTWACWTITSSTTDPDAYRCNFDLDNIDLLSPSHGATVSLPHTFTWRTRGITTDDYELELADMSDYNPYWWTSPLGYVGSYTLSSLPDGFTLGQQYGWWMWVYGPDGYGISYYYRDVTFSNVGNRAKVQTVPMSSRILKESIEVIAPLQSR